MRIALGRTSRPANYPPEVDYPRSASSQNRWFHEFLNDTEIAIYGVEGAGDGVETGRHAAPLTAGSPGVLHGNRTYLMSDEAGQIIEPFCISAGLDYPGVGPEHAWLKETGRAQYKTITDTEAVAAFHELTRVEGIIPALESAHAVAFAQKLAAGMNDDAIVVVNLSGRGDKDMHTVAALEGIEV